MNLNSKNETVGKLIELTINGKIKWSYLDSNDSLCHELNLTPKKLLRNVSASLAAYAAAKMNDKEEFDPDNSYYTRINSNYLVLFVKPATSNKEILAERLNLLLVPSSFRSVEIINDVDELVRLHTITKSGFPSVESIINDILKM